MLWRDNTDYAREVSEWMDGFARETGETVETLDPDTIEGEIFATSHDIMEYPTLVVTDSSSSILAKWSGRKNLPQYAEVSYVMRSV